MSKYIGTYELGDVFKCECDRRRKLVSPYLAAHWEEKLSFECECGRVYHTRRGKVWFVERARRAKQ